MPAAHSLTSRDLSAISANETCERLVRARVMRLTDQEAYQLITGQVLPSGRGERTAALRHGKVFDQHLIEDGARALLGSLGPVVDMDPGTVRITNIVDQTREASTDALTAAVQLTHQSLQWAAAGKPDCDLLVQPALRLSQLEWGNTVVRPDFLVLNPATGWYWPLEAKAYPALDGMIDPAERRAIRLQAAVQVIALQDYARLHAPHVQLANEALLVVASPFGLRPEPAFLEDLGAEVEQITRAVTAINGQVASLYAGTSRARQATSLREAGWHFQESCLVGCGLARFCRSQ